MPMPPATDAPPNPVPLCVDLDGTLIRTDLLWESLARLLRRNPFLLLPVLFWWMRGRAFLKKKLAARVALDPAALPYHGQFLAWLREQKAAGRKLVLVTASDRDMALPVANHVGLFDEVLGSDGKTNLRGANKLRALVARFGERGFDYAGNSSVDLPVWRGAREAIVVNASRALRQRAGAGAKLGPGFIEDYSPFATLKSFLNEFFVRSGYLVAIGAGLLLTAAFPKISIAGLAWVAPGLMIAAAWGKRGGDAFRAGYVAGLAHFLSSLYWLLLIPVTGFPILGWVALGAFLALYFGVWTWLVTLHATRFTFHESWLRRTLWALLGAAAWVALEMIRARFLGGFPWDPLGASQYQLIPLIQIASVTGVYGVSFLVVWLSLSLFSAARMIFRRPVSRFAWQAEAFLPLLVVAAMFAFGFVRLNRLPAPAATAHLTLVQPSIPQNLIWDPGANSNRFQQLLALSDDALNQADAAAREPVIQVVNATNETGSHASEASGKTEVLIWPESAVPEFTPDTYAAITNLVRTRHVWLIFNADDAEWRPDAKSRDDFDVFNAAWLFNPYGGSAGIYHKRKLVIFGEYIPLVNWLPFIKWFTPITGSFAAGHRPVPFAMALGSGLPVVAAPLICFEDTFPQLAGEDVQPDTDFLVNLTNDGWFGDGAAQWQHAATAVFRAVESGVPLVRCTNNGLTCWADATGRLRDIFRDPAGSVYGPGAISFALPLQKYPPTFYHRHGDWFGWLCTGLTGLLLARLWLRQTPETASKTA